MKTSSQYLHAGNKKILRFLMASLNEISQPWSATGQVVIKPTNSVNRLIPDILGDYPGRAIFLCCSLEEFLIPCFKKLRAAEKKLRWMALHLTQGTELQRHLAADYRHPFGFIESCVITWYLQMEYFSKAIDNERSDGIRRICMQDMLASPSETVKMAADFLEIDKPDSEIAAAVQRGFNRNSKFTARAYDRNERLKVVCEVKAKYESLLEAALAWAEQYIAPFAVIPKASANLLAAT
ncbi:MAG: hypothetical protein ABIM73_08015 [Arenimonas sp.]